MKKKIIAIVIAAAATAALGISVSAMTMLSTAHDEKSIEELRQELPEPDKQHVEEMEAQGYTLVGIDTFSDKNGYYVDLTFEKDNTSTHPYA